MDPTPAFCFILFCLVVVIYFRININEIILFVKIKINKNLHEGDHRGVGNDLYYMSIEDSKAYIGASPLSCLYTDALAFWRAFKECMIV